MDKNPKVFQNTLHRHLCEAYQTLLPFEITTAWIKDAELLESCRQLTHYITDTYDDIYEHPQEYGLTYDYVSNEIIHFHSNILRNPLRRSYGSFLDLAIERRDDCLILKNEDYDNMCKRIRNKVYNKVKMFKNPQEFERPFSRLQQRGLSIQRGESETVIRHTKYPLMFKAANLMFDADIEYYNKKRRSPQYFTLLNFKVLRQEPHHWELDDIISGISSEWEQNIRRLIAYMCDKVRVGKSYHVWYYRTADYTYKRRTLLHVRRDSGAMCFMCIPVFEPGTEEFRLLEEKINQRSDAQELKDFYRDNIRLCRFCGNSACVKKNAYKKEWLFFGSPLAKLIRSCDQDVMVSEFTEENYNRFRVFIDLYISVYDEI